MPIVRILSDFISETIVQIKKKKIVIKCIYKAFL